MSGTGSSTNAPTRLTPIVMDQPIVDAGTGQPTPYFGQMIQRILSYLGQPATSSSSGGTVTNLTITEQLTTLNSTVEVLQSQISGLTPQSGTISRVASLETTIRNLLRFNREPRPVAHRIITPPPKTVVKRVVIPAAPPPLPNFAAAQMLSWWRQ